MVMGGIFCLMGKSASGKDSLYRRLLEDAQGKLEPVVPWTTRPIREGEREGVEYHFTDREGLEKLEAEGRVLEKRVYHTVHGDWYYFTVDDGSILPEEKKYLMISTPEAYVRLKEHFGAGQVQALYIDVEDGERLMRALSRERMQEEPKYKEMCRRFLADCEDFSEEKLSEAGIDKRFVNQDFELCLEELKLATGIV